MDFGTFTKPFDGKNSVAFVNYNEFSNFKQESYYYASWFYNDTIYKILGLPENFHPKILKTKRFGFFCIW